MKELFEQYASYNLWANKILLEKLSSVSPEILFKETGSSFGNIYETVVHLMEVESIWWLRLKMQENVTAPEKDPDKNPQILFKQLLTLSQQWNDWVNDANENYFTHVFSYYNSKKEFFKQPVYQMLLHLFNHQTYHRGQIITILRQNGVDKIPPTDFIVFSRKK
ncbi:MAG: DinB family protein [Ginsengibacter sp.]